MPELHCPETSIAPVAALLLNAKAAAELCGIGRTTFLKLRSSDRTPAPIKIAGCVRWRRSDIEQWVELGCPTRTKFEQLTRGRSR